VGFPTHPLDGTYGGGPTRIPALFSTLPWTSCTAMVLSANHWEVEMLNDRRQFYLGNCNKAAAERRGDFYREESLTFEKNRDFRPEEPNSRVYLRAIEGVVEAARAGLSSEDFRAMLATFAGIHGFGVKDGAP
jgi:hypothetical protein